MACSRAPASDPLQTPTHVGLEMTTLWVNAAGVARAVLR